MNQKILAERWRVRLSVGVAYEQVIWDFSVCSPLREKTDALQGKTIQAQESCQQWCTAASSDRMLSAIIDEHLRWSELW